MSKNRSAMLYPDGSHISQEQLDSRHGLFEITNRNNKPKGIHVFRNKGAYYLRVMLKQHCPDQVVFQVRIQDQDVEAAFWSALAKMCRRVYLTSSEIAAYIHRLDVLRNEYFDRLSEDGLIG